ncbi:unnamed protein product [Adineta steineri]|uniref:Uncharacterized protein n=1 Tax=Adineta steineri TaxID=433720 RepID=A0A819DQV3_9BILA|nr:unnamed protein product [Adineta steineri]
MTYRQQSDWSSDSVSTRRQSYPLINRNAWAADDDDIDQFNQKKTSCAWTRCFKCFLVGALLAGIGLAIVLTLWLTPKTAATKTLAVTASASNSSSSLSVSTSIVTSSNTPSALTSISTSSERSSTATLPSSSSIATSTSTIFQTTATTRSTTSTSTSTSTTSTTSTTSVTTSTTTTMTTQNPELNSLSDKNMNDNTWTLFNCTYMSAILGNLILKFTMTTSNKHDWYLDDISVKNSTLVEMLTNGDFESSLTLTGWNTGSGGAISSAQSHSSSHSLYASSSTSISQSFSTISGVIYTISYWVYFEKTSNGNDPSAALDVTMN